MFGCGWQWVCSQESFPCCSPCFWLLGRTVLERASGSWSPAPPPTKGVDYFGIKLPPHPPLSLTPACQTGCRVWWTFPSFFFCSKLCFLLLWYISFALTCSWWPLHLACKTAMFEDPAITHSLLAMLVAEGFAFRLWHWFCCKGANIFLWESVCEYVERREEEQVKKREGEGGEWKCQR